MGREFVLQGKVVFKTDVNSIRKAVTQLNNQLAKLGKGTTLKITAPNLGKVSKELTDLNRNVAGFATNINNLSKSIKVTSQGVAKTISNTNKTAQQSLNQTAKAATNAKDAFEAFGKQAAVSARRYVSFAAVTGAFLKLTQAIKANVSEAISFDREVIRLLQVTGKTKAGISDLTKEIDRLSIGLGVSSKDLLDVSVTLAQAGLTARETKTALEAIAKSGVSASFGDMKDTGEAVIAIFQQFGYQASDLEGVLSSVNKVSAAFAVEAGDITTAVRRAGSSFKSAGATFNEFQGLFTSVRQTTRESAESIATGLRTIVSRLQRVRTQNFFKDLGIDLVKEGRFIGPLKAIEAISEATENLSRQDPVFASIAEELGGFRQINKVIPLLDKVAVTRKAINIGLRAENSLTGDSIIAQQALAIQIEKVRQEFQALIREITSSDAFRDVARTFLTISSAVIKTVDALQTLLPLVAGIGVATSSKRIASFTKGFFGFNKGGGVPGGVFGGSGGGFGPNNLPSGGASRSGFKFNPTSAGLAGIAVITVLSQFGEGVQKLIPIITTVASAFFLLNTTLKGISKETRPQLKAIARERLDNLNIGKKSAEQARVQSLKSDFYKIKSSELSNKISSTTDPKELARLQRKKNAADISAQQYSTEAVESLGTSQNAFQRRRQLRTDLLNRRATRNRRILIGAGIGAAATAAAPILSDVANTNALAGQERTFGLNTTAVAGAGGAVSGAVTGATTGAAIGSLFGPAGVAIGAAAGGVVGALNGLVTSIKDSSDKIQLAKFGESVQELRQKLRLVAEGKLSPGAVGGGILSSIRQTSLLAATSNPEQRQNIVATFNENQSEIEDFFYKIAEESQTLDEFNSRTKGLLGTFAVLTKIPFKDLEKSISDTIDKNKIKSNLDAKSIVEQNKLLQNITTMNVTIGAFNSAALSIENTNRKLLQFSSAIDGSINLLESRDFASVIKTGGEGQLFGGNQFGSAVNAVSGFIPNGAASANSILESTRVNQVLPAILKRVSATIPREGEGNFETRLEKELQAVTNNNDVISAILTKVGGVIGTTGEDKKAIERVNEDVLGFSKEISNSFSPLVDLFSEGASRLQDRINATVKAFDDLGKIVNNIKSLELERIGVEEKLDKTLRDRLGIQDPGNAGFNRRRLQTITGGETSVGGLVRQFEDARKAAQNLQLLRDTSLSTNDALISEQKKLALASEAAVKGLEFLARESNDLSDRFARDAEQGRELRSNALTRVVGTAEERISLRRQQSLIGRVRSSGTFAGIPEEDRRGIAEKIELLFPEEFKKIFSADLIRQGFSQEQAQSAVQGKTQNTDSILEEIKKNAETQSAAITALQQIQSTLASDIQKGITSANAQFSTEVANLSQRIKELADSIITDKGDREQRLGAISEQTKGISNIFGGAKIGGKNFASLSGAADLLEERGGLLQQKSVTSPEFIKETFDKLTKQIDTSNTEGVLKLVDQLEGLTGTTFTNARAGISDTISSVGGVKIGKNQTAKDFFFTNFQKDINEQIPSRLKGINEKLGVNSSELAFRGLTPVNQDVKSIEESVKLIRSFVSAVEQVGGPSKIPHFASGGVVPGSGNRDSVLAMLTPGEVVLNKNQVKSARGGGGGYSIDASAFNDVVVKFSNAAGSLSKSLDQFPREITLSANHKVEVIFNGAEILTRLMPEIQNIAIEESKLAINKMIDQKFPDVGRVRL